MKRETTSARLKQLMKERNLKQIDILRKCEPVSEKYTFGNGKKVKISKSDLSQWLSGKYEPGQWKLTILAEALDTNEVWLMGLDVPNVPKNEYQNAINKVKKKEVLKEFLIERGFLDKSEKFTDEELDRLIDFAIANKKYIMKDKK